MEEKEEIIKACKIIEGSAIETLQKQIDLLSERSHSGVANSELVELTKAMILAINCAFGS